VSANGSGKRHAEINNNEAVTAYAPHHVISVSNNAVLPLLFHVFYGEVEVHEQTALFYGPVVGHSIQLSTLNNGADYCTDPDSLKVIPKSFQTMLA
jgi:hypothetical protein